jgi:hypothetical protein
LIGGTIASLIAAAGGVAGDWSGLVVALLLVLAALCFFGGLAAFGLVGRRHVHAAPRAFEEAIETLPPPTVSKDGPLVKRSLREIWDLFDGLTDLQADRVIAPFIGERAEISGAIHSVMDFESFVQVTLARDEDHPYNLHTTYCIFNDRKWRTALARMSVGDLVTIRGNFERITSVDMQFRTCELVNSPNATTTL